MQGREALTYRLGLLRRRVLLIGGLSALGWAVVAAIAAWLILVWLDLLWDLSPRVRLLSNLAAVVTGALLLLLISTRWLRNSQNRILARRLDRAGNLGGQIIVGYELADELSRRPRADELSTGLAELAVNRAATLAQGVRPDLAVRSRPLRAPVLLLGALFLSLTVVTLAMPRLAHTEWLRFFDPTGDHPPFSRIRFVVEPGDVKVLYGGGLDVLVSTEGPPVEQVELIMRGAGDTNDDPLPMFPESDGTWRAVLTSCTNSGEYYVRAGRSRSERFALDVITVPVIEQVRFRVTPPAYTRRARYEGSLPAEGLVGLLGTEIRLSAKSNRPLSAGTVVIAGGAQSIVVPLAPESEGAQEVHGAFTLTAAGKFEVRVQDIAGIASNEAFSGGITIVADQRPLVRILEPAATSLATPEATLPVVLAGEDDYGIARLQLFRSLNDSRGLPMDFAVPQPSATRFGPTQPLPLSAYGLGAGDVIKLFARIEDNDPGGAKGSESAVCEVRIISQEEFNQMIRAREGLEALLSKYRQAERRLEALAEERDGLRKKLDAETVDELSPAVSEALKKLAQQMRSDAEANRQALEHLLPYDLDAALAERLAKLAKKLDAAAAAASDLAGKEHLTREQLEQLLDQLDEQLNEEREQLADEALAPLEHLEAIFPLIEDQSRFVELYKQQRELSQRLASLAGHDGEDDPRLKTRMRDLEAEQQRLRISLDQLLGDIENHAMRLPEDEQLDDLRASALQFADAVRASGAIEAMSEAEAGLAEFSGTRGHEAATRAADILEQFINQSSGVSGKGRACLAFQPQLGSSLGNTVDQLLAELGLSPGDGPAGGSGGGSSARRSTLSNVGLYGRVPGRGDVAHSGSGRGPAGVGQRGGGAANSGDAPNLVDVPQNSRASGSSGASIPAAYRRRVGAYFQRLAEENGSR